ncbi:MAG: hypothetical protein KAI79_20740, partial [Bacteroidales bacterium]|nr:hypothetical protein [Bacteroidales bacterium]
MELDLNIFSALLVPAGIAPDKDFLTSKRLMYVNSPDSDLRATIRYPIGQAIEFHQTDEEDIKDLGKYWRAELAPDMGEEHHENDEFNEQDLEDLSSDAPV